MKSDAKMMIPAGRNSQYDRAFRNGKATSRAPTWSGIRKFPKAPTRIGMTTKKIMIVPCIVTSWLYPSGLTLPSSLNANMNEESGAPITGTGLPG